MSRAHRIVTIAACATALALGAAWESRAQNMFQALQYDQRVVETTKTKKLKKYGTRQFQNNGGDGIEGEEITILYFAQAQPR